MKKHDHIIYEFGPFRLDPAPGLRLTRDGTEVTIIEKGVRKKLTGKAFDVLLTLVKRSNEVVTRKVLQNEVWEGYRVDKRVIHQNVKRIREFLGDDPKAPEYIETVPGQGYRFIKQVNEVKEFPKQNDLAEQVYNDGLGHLYTFKTEGELNKAISCFKQAYTYQPNHSPALSAAAEAHIWLSFFSWQDAEKALTDALRLAEKARNLDPSMSDAQATYALADLLLHRNWAIAKKVFERVLRRNPTSLAALRGYALWLMANGSFDDALRKIDELWR